MNTSGGRFGLTTLTCIVIASMIGSGVFTTSGFSLAALGSPTRVLAAWLVGGVIAFCGAVAYGELARRIPLSGGEYVYLSRRLHPFAGFLAGWVSLTAGFSGAIALAALTFEEYAVPDGVRPVWLPARSVAAAAILSFGLGHAYLARPVTALQNTIVSIKLMLLTTFLVIAGLNLSTHVWHTQPIDAPLPTLLSMPFVSTFASSVMWISLSYLGFNAAVYVAGEARDPERTVPRSLWLGTLLVTVFYLLLNLVFTTAAPMADVVAQPEVAAIAARSLGGPRLELLMRVAVALGTLTSVAGMIMTGPRVFSRMADDGMFPLWFQTGPQSVTRTVLLQTAIAAGLVFVNDLKSLIEYLSTTLALSSAVTVATLLLPTRTASPTERITWPIRFCAILFVLATLLVAGLMAVDQPSDLKAAGITFLTGAVLWLTVVKAVRR